MTAIESAVYRYSGGVRWNDSGEIMLVCPACRHTGKSGGGKLAFNVFKGGGQCFHCGETYNATKFMKALGRVPVALQSQGYRSQHRLLQVTVTSPNLGWSSLAGDRSYLGRRAVAYLVGRGFTEDMIAEYGLGLGESDRLLGRVVFPVVNNGKLVYYQARIPDYVGEPKYLNPIKGEGCLGSGSVVGFLDTIVPGAPIVICEGLLSAIGASKIYDIPGVCLFGKSMSETQRDLIAIKRPSRAVFLLEHDADPKFATKAQRLLEGWGIGMRTIQLEKAGGDPWDLWTKGKPGVAFSTPRRPGR